MAYFFFLLVVILRRPLGPAAFLAGRALGLAWEGKLSAFVHVVIYGADGRHLRTCSRQAGSLHVFG